MPMDRRHFLQLSLALAGLSACGGKERPRPVPGAIVGANAAVGHLLRDERQPPHSDDFRRTGILIVGAGVAGLSAARHLERAGYHDFKVLDLEDVAGGNSRSGSNAISPFPWGAHYVPTPNNDLTEYLQFLREADVVTGFDALQRPVYNEYHLCFDPQERLFLNGRWQEGLVPQFGLPAADLREIDRFLARMDEFRKAIGSDGRPAFAIPVDASSRDARYTGLDRITFRKWMEEAGFRSPYVHWYADYCTRDDFGARHDVVSAWAGIHYFAARKGAGANAAQGDVLTWPNGNAFLVDALRKGIEDRILTGHVALHLRTAGKGVTVDVLDVKKNASMHYGADHCLLAIPQFAAAHLMRDHSRRDRARQALHYTPWMVANLQVRDLPERPGVGSCWDNVLYDSPSLGYVDATHQLIRERSPLRNLTYYLPLTEGAPEAARRAARGHDHAHWAETVLRDLEPVHPGIRKHVERLDVLLWGHAMAQPLPGLLHGPLRAELALSPHPCVHFAHSDLAGISIFEEAFYQGLGAAKKILAHA
ncbi:NAD(P)/FAD-dependent oxidoreductase [Flaviaesturariibacter amylovorans]|uniref:NAD(P)/FAD-dependent oxidoreductase n=2 Tax=Flaviaesturariibacter amylovorans TaxID=1084520 RepID=A0ABP8GYJ4_9BACT